MAETPFVWTCPYCGRDTTIAAGNYRSHAQPFQLSNAADGDRYIVSEIVICPNPSCRQFTLTISEHRAIQAPREGVRLWPPAFGRELRRWRLIPPSEARVYPDYIPQAIRGDYTEACLIRDLSPKASATLARRCLQGMIRDYWEITGQRDLYHEISAIRDKVDPLTWNAMDAVRSVGNIGAHMGKDIDLIIDVDPGEANQLIALIEVLMKEWYIHRYERAEQMRSIHALANEKGAQRADASASDSSVAPSEPPDTA